MQNPYEPMKKCVTEEYFYKTFRDQSDFSGLSRSWNFQKNPGLSRRCGNPDKT